ACTLIREQLRQLLQKDRLVESWHLVYERAYRALVELASTLFQHEQPFLDLDLNLPVTAAVFREALLQAFTEHGGLPTEFTRLKTILGGLAGSRTGRLVDLGQLDADIAWLEREGRRLQGPLLPPGDLKGEERLRVQPQGHWVEDQYSDGRLAESVRQSLIFLVEAYREMAETNFPSFCTAMPLYQALPARVE